jgi:A/G-specific adenine glycosylase
MEFDLKRLKTWFLTEQRALPWRENRTPYAVWVSEMMLQQTQVAVVIPYFARWMQRFPSIQHLADASLDEVIKVWEGLGYYSRARYLHAGARYIVDQHQGIFPDHQDDIEKIKGLGAYTSGAIRSFAFHQKTPAVDGNVLRVLARYFKIEEDISKPKTVKQIREIAANILPEDESWIINEALIELGATICGRQPKCLQCPLRNNCRGYAAGVANELPIKSAKVQSEALYRSVAVIRAGVSGDLYLVNRCKKGAIMSDLHEFPYFESNLDGLSVIDMQQKILEQLQCKVSWKEALSLVAHSFTKYRVRLTPHLFVCNNVAEVAGYQWLSLEELQALAFSSGHRRILNNLLL